MLYSKCCFAVTELFTRISKNVLHGVICKRCHIIYIGETGRRLSDGITEHMRAIRKNLLDAVPQHLSLSLNRSQTIFYVVGIIPGNNNNDNSYFYVLFHRRAHSPFIKKTIKKTTM